MVALQYVINFWRTLEMWLISCEINIFLIWSEKYIYITGVYGNKKTKFTIIYTKLYVPVVTLSAQDDEKLSQQLKADFRRTINWNKHKSEPIL